MRYADRFPSVLSSQKQAATTAVLGLSLIAAILAVYSNSLNTPFLLDDIATLLANPSVTRLWPLSAVLFPPADVYTAGRPLLNLSFALNHAISGTSVWGYHVTNLAIHAAAALALFGIVRRTLTLPKFREQFGDSANLLAFGIAALWALHPLQTVSVTYISQRAESLMGLFYMATLYCFIRSAQRNATRWRIASLTACALGMATKEVMVTAPLVVFLYDWHCVSGSLRSVWRQRGRYYVGLGATWILLGALMLSSNLNHRAVGLGLSLSWLDYAQLQCRAIAHYLHVSLWPDLLIFDYGPDLPRPSRIEVLTKGGMVIGLLALAVYGLWRGRAWGLLGCVFFLLLGPTSSVVPIAGQPIAENRMYLPLAVLLFLVAGGLHRVLSRRSQAFLCGTGILFSVLTYARNADYRTEVGIWTDTVAKQPSNGRAWFFLSMAHARAGQPKEALQSLAGAVRHRPNDAALHNNLAVGYFSADRLAEAKTHFERALQLNPNYTEAYYNLGALLYKTNDVSPALQCFEASLRLKPDSVEAQNYAGLCGLRLGDLPLAIRHFQRAVELDPKHQAAQANLRQALGLRQ